MQFRIRWNLWRAAGATKDEARKAIVELISKHPQQFFDLEDASLFNERKGLLRRLIQG